MSPQISIIVPVYNSAVHLLRCINSILQQSFADFELILIDDGSSDESASILDECAKKDARLVVVHKCNEGVSIARNCGIERARGKYITFVDSDDFIDQNVLSAAICMAQKTGASLVQWGLHKQKDDGTYEEKSFDEGFFKLEDAVDKNATELYWTSCNKLFLTSLVKDNGIIFPPHQKIGEDAIFCYKCYLHAKTVYSLHNYHYTYVYNETSATRKTIALEEILKNANAIRELEVYAEKLGKTQIIQEHIFAKKQETKNYLFYSGQKPYFALWRKAFAEINKSYVFPLRKNSIVYIFVLLHLDFLANAIFCFYKKFVFARQK